PRPARSSRDWTFWPRPGPCAPIGVSGAPSASASGGSFRPGSRSVCCPSSISPRPDAELRLRPPAQPLTARWRELPSARRGSTLLGISFRPRQVEALGLDGPETLRRLLAYPFQMIRLGAYWNRIEPTPGAFDTRELDWQLDAAERAG